MTKLTLSVDENTIQLAKQKAAENNTSISAMFSEYITSLAKDSTGPAIAPLTQKATGLVELEPGKSDKELLAEALAERHSS